MSDSILYLSMGQGRVNLLSLIYSFLINHCNICGSGKTLSYNNIRHVGLVNFRWSTIFGACLRRRVGLSLRDYFVQLCYVVSILGCCRSSQNNLPDIMLQQDFNTKLDLSYVISIILASITYHGRDRYFPSIRSWDSSLFMMNIIIVFTIFYFSYNGYGYFHSFY